MGREKRGRHAEGSPPEFTAEPSSSPHTFGLGKGRRGTRAQGRPRAQRPYFKGTLHYPRPSVLVAFSLGPDPWLPRSSQAQHLSSPCSPPVCVCSPVSGNVLRPRKRREGRVTPSDTFPDMPPSRQGFGTPRALEVGAPKRVPLEPALSSSAGPHLEKCGRVGGGGWGTGAPGSRNRLQGLLPPRPYGVPTGRRPRAPRKREGSWTPLTWSSRNSSR